MKSINISNKFITKIPNHHGSRRLSKELKNCKILPKEELNDLVEKARNGCNRSKELVVKSCMRAMYNLSNKISFSQSCLYDTDDLFQIGMEAVLKAIHGFKREFDASFLAYALVCAQGAMLTFLNKHNSILSVSSNYELRNDFLALTDAIFNSDELNNIHQCLIKREEIQKKNGKRFKYLHFDYSILDLKEKSLFLKEETKKLENAIWYLSSYKGHTKEEEQKLKKLKKQLPKILEEKTLIDKEILSFENNQELMIDYYNSKNKGNVFRTDEFVNVDEFENDEENLDADPGWIKKIDFLVLDDDSMDSIDHESLQIDLKRSLNTLTTREKEILERYFGLSGFQSKSLDEISEEFNLTRERTRQIKEKAIRRLKHSRRADHIRKYLGGNGENGCYSNNRKRIIECINS